MLNVRYFFGRHYVLLSTADCLFIVVFSTHCFGRINWVSSLTKRHQSFYCLNVLSLCFIVQYIYIVSALCIHFIDHQLVLSNPKLALALTKPTGDQRSWIRAT